MYPEDRVLVAYLPDPTDFAILQQEGWYRIPQQHAPKGLYAEYLAFYFGRPFGSEKWTISYYAPRLGHELVTRAALFPHEPDHPRAQALYYKVQLGPLQKLARPIISLRWRRITFIHTTWDRFQDAVEINDLFIEGDQYVDRLFATLRECGLRPEREYEVKEAGAIYHVPLTVLCQNGRIDIHPHQIPQSDPALRALVERITQEAADKGGIQT